MGSQSSIPLVTADEWWGKCKKIDVLGEQMSYYDSDPKQEKSKHAVVFLHGNPTSSYVWRNVIPKIEPITRCLALDLMGHGRSNKLSSGSLYRFVDQYRYFSAWMDSVNLPEKVSVVGHDWGASLSFHWCNEHRDRVLSIVHMESLGAPLQDWNEIGEGFVQMVQALRTDAGLGMVLEQNMFIEQLLPGSTMRKLEPAEMDAYREPYLVPGESRRPTLTWAREMPVVSAGPDDVVAIASAYSEWLRESTSIPKLFVKADPGSLAKEVMIRTTDWPNQTVVEVKGLHFVQEDAPNELAMHIKKFLANLYK